MRLLFYLSIGILSIMFMYACTPQKKTSESGLVIHTTKIYDTLSKTFRSVRSLPEIKIWFQDSLLIEEVMYLTTKDSGGKILPVLYIDHYLLVDLRKKWFCEFSSFSDTARLLKSFPAEGASVAGLNFFPKGKDSFTRAPMALADTTIDSIRLKRYLVHFVEPQLNILEEWSMIAYSSCRSGNRIFKYLSESDFPANCLITRIDYVPTPEHSTPLSLEMHFIRNTLTAEEQKIFKAWGKRL